MNIVLYKNASESCHCTCFGVFSQETDKEECYNSFEGNSIMIVKAILVMLVVIVVTMPDVEAGCKWRCTWRGCSWKCSWGWGKKREASEMQDPSAGGFRAEYVLKLPYKMSIYDANKDGRISRKEFVKILPQPYSTKSVVSTFDSLDKNGDKYISCQELGKVAPDGKAKC